MNIADLSLQYNVRKLTADDVDSIYELSVENPMFYQYCPPFVTKESILEDMKALPPRTSYEDKFYVGFFKGEKLIAVMDLIFNFPDTQTAFIGLFMMSKAEQGKGIGSGIIRECGHFIQSQGYSFIRLGFAKGNPQSEAFWKKNGFVETGVESDNGSYTVVVMQKNLREDLRENGSIKARFAGESRMEEKNLLDNINKLHTTQMGVERIKKNLKIDTDDVVEYCKARILDRNCRIYKQGKNWYCETDNIKITINSFSYTIITAHIIQ